MHAKNNSGGQWDQMSAWCHGRGMGQVHEMSVECVHEVGCCGMVMGKKSKDRVGVMLNMGGGRDGLGCKVSVGAKA
ncbi:hypothetical protein PIB30_095689 [Stylosanthes scabra]|uniref:Uncharacterized protein n=1 Tax=Stylosanthes scabra TaxID=79078 RepID=A0ABU6UV65_9FABA|nr:hypothetical protein [Stylosanthes scabra]